MTSEQSGTDTEQDGASEVRPDGFPLQRRELAVIGAFWLLFALVTFANRALDPRRPGSDRDLWLGTITISLTQALMWAVLTVPLFLIAARVTTGRDGRPARVLLLVGASLLAALLVNTVVDQVREAVLPLRRFGGGRFGGPRSRSWWSLSLGGFQFLNDVVIAMGVVAGGFARAFSLSSRARQEQATQLKAQLAEARLDALRRQLDPHFLFNTLHAVSSLVERDPRGVRRMISRLSELLRHSIEDANEPEIALRKELDLLSRYVEIMQVRFQGRLEVETIVPPDLLNALVPNMILQPLVENAIKHGVEQQPGDGRIEIEVSRSGNTLILRISDNGPGYGVPPTPGVVRVGGVGVRNTVARLEQLYGGAQQFVLRPREAGGTVAEVRLPYHTEDDLRTEAMRTDAPVAARG